MIYRIHHKIILLLVFVLPLLVGGCTNEEPPMVNPHPESEYTLFMYLPWSSNLTPYFLTNIQDIETAYLKNGSLNQRLIVFFSSSPQKGEMYEIKIQNDSCIHAYLKDYDYPRFTTEAGLTQILCDVKSFAPATNYSMIIGCHGMGWLPVTRSRAMTQECFKAHYLYEDSPLTRYFGGLEAQYQTDISTLAQSISSSGIHMDFILFDDCYMSSIEVAYCLKDVTDYIIGCPTEIMAFGMPYHKIGRHLFGKPDYSSVCQEFYDFYRQYTYPWGTIGVTNCKELDEMARIVSDIYAWYGDKLQDVYSIQRMDGYDPIIFFDFKDYVLTLCEDSDLANDFLTQFDRLVPFHSHTEKFFTASRGPLEIEEFCGITTSAPSLNAWSQEWKNTLWYKATH